MMNSNKEYAKALFMLAAEQGKINEYSALLSTIENLIKDNPQYPEILASPALPMSERLSYIGTAFAGYPEHLISFLKLVCENGHIRELPDYIKEFAELKAISKNSLTVNVYSAVPLNDKQKSTLTQRLAKKYGKHISARYNVDKSLLGGMKIEIDGKTFDGSITRKLNSIKGVING